MKYISKIMFGIFCLIASLCFAFPGYYFSNVVVGREGIRELFHGLYRVSGAFIILGMYHAITGYFRAWWEDKKQGHKKQDDKRQDDMKQDDTNEDK